MDTDAVHRLTLQRKRNRHRKQRRRRRKTTKLRRRRLSPSHAEPHEAIDDTQADETAHRGRADGRASGDVGRDLGVPLTPPYTSSPDALVVRGGGGGGGLCCAGDRLPAVSHRRATKRGGQNVNYCPPPFYALHRLCPLALRSHAGRLLSLWLFVLRKNTALSRGWCTPLTRGSAVCGAKRIAQHANPGLLSSPVRLSAFPQNVIKRNQADTSTRAVITAIAIFSPWRVRMQIFVCVNRKNPSNCSGSRS